MRNILSILLLLSSVTVQAQLTSALTIDSLKGALTRYKEDTTKVDGYVNVSFAYLYVNQDSSISYANAGLNLARKLNYSIGEVLLLIIKGEAFAQKQDFNQGLELKLEALPKAEALGDSGLLSFCYLFTGANYIYSEDYETALTYYNKAKAYSGLQFSENKYLLGPIGTCYLNLDKLDSAYYYTKLAFDLDQKDAQHFEILYQNMGEIEQKRGNYRESLRFFRIQQNLVGEPSIGIATTFNKMGQRDSAIYYAKHHISDTEKSASIRLRASSLLADLYASSHALDSAFKYQQLMLALKDTIYNQEKAKQLKNIEFNERQRQLKAEQQRKEAQQQYETRIRLYSLIAGMLVISLIALLLWRNNRQRKKAYNLLQRQKQEIDKQKRELEIEAVLERVRTKALAMQSSEDLISVANELREQMGKLGQPELESCIVHLYNGDAETFNAWYAYSPAALPKTSITGVATIHKNSTEWTREAVAKYQSLETDYTIVSSGKKLQEHYASLEQIAPSTIDYDDRGKMIVPEVLHYHFSKFSGGALLMISNKEPSSESREMLKRAAAVFDLAYTRFNDLKQAESQAKEAIRQAALDRVRAEIASMRTTTDLERITPLIWRELTTLHVPFIRCGVFIMNEAEEQTQIYLSTPDGNAIVAFQLPFNNKGFIEGVISHWRSHQIFTDHWDETTFSAWTKSLVEQGVVKVDERYSVEKAPEVLYLHFLPFLQGMLYVGNTAPLKEEELSVAQALAEAFATAYARYEDFNKLDTAKQQVEITLTELKSTQAQLIQSEKMASLGELTAGIAHEIQNPLNFVNNFSETNTELIEEMEQEIDMGNLSAAKQIAVDVKQNNIKINQHGRRADGIVKAMMQHSRKGTGEKQLTNLNALVDEYLRLAYHGFRAKDKSFNATIQTHFEESIGKINIIPQEIGRVLLNLFNNAFYAVAEKMEKLGEEYKPTAFVSTKKLNNKIEITVKDNGTGIPQQVVDKIFQPFFTTKPTGEGTGLGLSLSYDIVKAHGGELRVESKEGEGTEFTISLPAVHNT